MMETFADFGGRQYFLLVSLLLLGRGTDFLSTWVATPHLVLEGNPVAKKLGWRWGAAVNVAVCLVFGVWPLAAVVIITTSCLVAARNFQSAWLMRTLGEEGYRNWYVERLREVPLVLYLFCLGGQVLLPAAVGGALMVPWLRRPDEFPLLPFGIGLGIVSYSLAVAFYTLLALWRIRGSVR